MILIEYILEVTSAFMLSAFLSRTSELDAEKKS